MIVEVLGEKAIKYLVNVLVEKVCGCQKAGTTGKSSVSYLHSQ